jgi:hypothetical protein
MIRAIALCLLASPAAASTAHVWSGPGPNACIDRCTEQWGKNELSDAQRAELAGVQARNPLPQYLPVEDGDYIPLMAYFKDRAIMDRHGTIAVLDAPSPAWGWQMRGWRFVRIDACGNWAVVIDRAAKPLPAVAPVLPRTAPEHLTSSVQAPSGGGWPPLTVLPPVGSPAVPPVTPGPSPVPLPATGLLLLLALGLIKRLTWRGSAK